jgi:hypothetical protein
VRHDIKNHKTKQKTFSIGKIEDAHHRSLKHPLTPSNKMASALVSKVAKDRIYALICIPSSKLEDMYTYYQRERDIKAQEVCDSTATASVNQNMIHIECEDTEKTYKMVEEATRDYEFILEAIPHLMKYRETPLGKEMEDIRRGLRGTIRTASSDMVPWDKIHAHDEMECEMVWDILMEKMKASEF